jgi:hypothetical protein
VALDVLVEAAGTDLALDVSPHVGDFFGPLVNEQHELLDLGEVGRHGLADVLEHDRLAAAGRRDDQGPLAAAQRREQIHHARGQRHRPGLQAKPFVRVDRRFGVERLDVEVFLGRHAIDVGDLAQPRALLAAGRLHRALDHHALPQAIALDHRAGHEGVAAFAGVGIVGAAEEAVAVGVHLQEAIARLKGNLGRRRRGILLLLALRHRDRIAVFVKLRGGRRSLLCCHRAIGGCLAAEGRAVLPVAIVPAWPTPATTTAAVSAAAATITTAVSAAVIPITAAAIAAATTAARTSATKLLFSHCHRSKKMCAARQSGAGAVWKKVLRPRVRWKPVRWKPVIWKPRPIGNEMRSGRRGRLPSGKLRSSRTLHVYRRLADDEQPNLAAIARQFPTLCEVRAYAGTARASASREAVHGPSE